MNKKRLIMMVALILLISYAFVSASNFIANEAKYENSLIRFHVLANSDSPEDQQLKLKVRDRIMMDMAEVLEGVSSIAESRDIITDNLNRIQQIAKEEIEKNGIDYEVEVVLGEHIFPTRKYGNIIFSAGNYEALRVIIGEGEGQNWWCVMFPPLCFIDVKNGLVDEKTQQQLQSALSEEEYQLVYAQVDEKEIPLQLRSKIVDFYRSSRDQVVKLATSF
ncbi:stage II sporulation protein R [Alkaliphilus transvaalensis]|uniref:stage II sporulation protein R n=1 Tax=Alkaliphilus transvaalensis TaxID=114628 RepID=UPI00047DBE6D|nr:stage II sporulation protein R [Alkaliphilus transvaalensis]